MKELLKKSIAAVAAATTSLAPVATQLPGAVAARAGLATATSALVLLAPTAAEAQSGKRICATVWGLRASGSHTGLASIGMEVSKYDIVTCGALIATWATLTGLPTSVRSMAEGLLGTAAGVGTGLVGSLRYNQTCEAFSSSIHANTNDVCLSMKDYRLYTFVKVYGGPFSMGRSKL